MPDYSRFKALSARERAIVSIAVMLDGHDAAEYLMSDKDRAPALARAAKDFAEFPVDLRMSLAGTLLRRAVDEINKS